MGTRTGGPTRPCSAEDGVAPNKGGDDGAFFAIFHRGHGPYLFVRQESIYMLNCTTKSRMRQKKGEGRGNAQSSRLLNCSLAGTPGDEAVQISMANRERCCLDPKAARARILRPARVPPLQRSRT